MADADSGGAVNLWNSTGLVSIHARWAQVGWSGCSTRGGVIGWGDTDPWRQHVHVSARVSTGDLGLRLRLGVVVAETSGVVASGGRGTSVTVDVGGGPFESWGSPGATHGDRRTETYCGNVV